MLEYYENKYFIVDAYSEGDRIFIATELNDGKIVSCEYICWMRPSTSIAVYDNLVEFVAGTTWLDYIREGIQDDRILELLKKRDENGDAPNDQEE